MVGKQGLKCGDLLLDKIDIADIFHLFLVGSAECIVFAFQHGDLRLYVREIIRRYFVRQSEDFAHQRLHFEILDCADLEFGNGDRPVSARLTEKEIELLGGLHRTVFIENSRLQFSVQIKLYLIFPFNDRRHKAEFVFRFIHQIRSACGRRIDRHRGAISIIVIEFVIVLSKRKIEIHIAASIHITVPAASGIGAEAQIHIVAPVLSVRIGNYFEGYLSDRGDSRGFGRSAVSGAVRRHDIAVFNLRPDKTPVIRDARDIHGFRFQGVLVSDFDTAQDK